jgi:hypothetical protein
VLLRSRVSMLLAAATMLMAMLMALSAGPAFGEVDRIFNLGVTDEGMIIAKGVVTPSGRINCNAHFRPAEREGRGGGGAKHFERQSPTIRSPEGGMDASIHTGVTTSKGVQTPSDNVNASCHGQLPEE